MNALTTTISRRTLCLVAGAAALVVAGCGGPEGPDVQFVEGVVTLDGKPLDGATVTFLPVDKTGISAAGKTDAAGRFRLNATQGKKYGKGTVAGDYVVTVQKLFWPEKADDRPEQTVEPDHITPLVYEDSKKSLLKATIVKGRNTFEFGLTSKPAR
ncbi:MAG: hypothetical protein ACKOWG_00445 [Planctomycetia bacterium]